MLKRSIVLGLILLLTGAAVLRWALAEKKNQQEQISLDKSKHVSKLSKGLQQYDQWLDLPPEERPLLPPGLDEYGEVNGVTDLQQQQRRRLKADLDRLAGGEMDTPPLANFLYGENWQEELNEYIRRKERNEFVLTASIVCTSIGGAIFTSCLLAYVSRFIIGVLSRLWKLFTGVFASRRVSEGKSLFEAEVTTDQENSQKSPNDRPNLDSPLREQESREQQCQLGTRSKAVAGSAAQNSNDNRRGRRRLAPSERALSIAGEPCLAGRDSTHRENRPATHSRNDSAKVASASSDEEAFESTEPLAAGTEAHNAHKAQLNLVQNAQQTALLEPDSDPVQCEDSLKAQIDDLERKVEQMRQMAGDPILQDPDKCEPTRTVHQAIAEHSDTLNGTLMELTQQVAAIREYASDQQDRVKKLQEGYDWNIIRNFCLRFIRCIDNLEDRISRQSAKSSETAHLKEVRDELLFGLESSGVERFEPEVDSQYRGQEKHAEAVKQRERCDDPDKGGKIAKVIRPGYRYFIDEQNAKIVRPATVKLFG